MAIRRPPLRHLLIVAVIVGVLAALVLAGQQLLYDYAWVVLPGVFAVALGARAVDEYRRRRRRAKFRR